jgi:hypothetical protein
VKLFAHNLATTSFTKYPSAKKKLQKRILARTLAGIECRPLANCSPLLIEVRELLAIFVTSGKTAKARR